MKQLFLFILMMLPMVVMGQKDITTFLGIPVDGTKASMIQKLKDKGYTYNRQKDFLEGEFNGRSVHIYVITNNNRVYRIAIFDKNYSNAADIKVHFNNLVYQFSNNNKYTTLNDHTLSDSEDISYEMTVHNKIYEAAFYQVPDWEKIDTLSVTEQLKNEFLKKYSPEELVKPTEEIQQKMIRWGASRAMDLIYKKLVWFRIFYDYGKYQIGIFYENKYNEPNGEDL